jgi:hypothetical protein
MAFPTLPPRPSSVARRLERKTLATRGAYGRFWQPAHPVWGGRAFYFYLDVTRACLCPEGQPAQHSAAKRECNVPYHGRSRSHLVHLISSHLSSAQPRCKRRTTPSTLAPAPSPKHQRPSIPPRVGPDLTSHFPPFAVASLGPDNSSSADHIRARDKSASFHPPTRLICAHMPPTGESCSLRAMLRLSPGIASRPAQQNGDRGVSGF